MIASDLPLPDPSATEIRDRADAIVARPEYRETESLLERGAGWIDELWSDIVGGLAGGGVGGLISWLILAALVGALLWLLLRITPMAGLARVTAAEAVVNARGPVATEFLTAGQWRREADRFAAQGAFAEALRARYRALLADLIELGLIDDIAGRTPGEYRNDLWASSAASVAAPFASATDLFESVWYGPDDADSPDLQRFQENERAVLAGVDR